MQPNLTPTTGPGYLIWPPNQLPDIDFPNGTFQPPLLLYNNYCRNGLLNPRRRFEFYLEEISDPFKSEAILGEQGSGKQY